MFVKLVIFTILPTSHSIPAVSSNLSKKSIKRATAVVSALVARQSPRTLRWLLSPPSAGAAAAAAATRPGTRPDPAAAFAAAAGHRAPTPGHLHCCRQRCWCSGLRDLTTGRLRSRVCRHMFEYINICHGEIHCIGIRFNHVFYRYVGAEPAHIQKRCLGSICGQGTICGQSASDPAAARRPPSRSIFVCFLAICYIMVRHGAGV